MARYTLPTRQKMINLLYILLIAMLTINTISDAQKGKDWVPMPDRDANEVTPFASYQKTENRRPIGNRFRVKTLPSPTSYLRCTPNTVYHGNVPVKRSTLLAATEIGASIADPEMEYKVLSFETILIKENGKQLSTAQTEGNKLTLEQKKLIGQLEEGDTFYITSILVEGLDGQKCQSSPINVIVIK